MGFNIYSLTLIVLFIIKVHSLSSILNDGDSQEEDVYAPGGLVLPKQIFNDGKPFYVEKDPISGQLDFSSKKPAGIEPENNEIFAPKEKIVLSASSPNIHDFLNLPVKYSSSKFVYPLVSSSYANLKYQGNNKNFISSQKMNFPPTVATTISPSYYTLPKKETTTAKPKPTTTTKPLVTKQFSVTTFRPTTKTTLETKTSTTIRHIPSIFDRTTQKNKYVPTKKYTTTTAYPPVSTEKYQKYTKYTKSTTVTTPTTPKNATQSTTRRTTPSTTKLTTFKISSTIRTTTSKLKNTTTPFTSTTGISTTMMPKKNISFETTTKKPVTTTIQTSVKPKLPEVPFFPLPSERPTLTTLDPADVYNKIEKKNEAPLFMSDIFNALAGEDDGEEYSEGLDSTGNLIHPFSPSKPSPFTLQQVTKATFPNSNQTSSSTRPNSNTKLNENDNKNQIGKLPNSSLIHTTDMIFQQHDRPQFAAVQQISGAFPNGLNNNHDDVTNTEQTENSQQNQYVDEYVNYQVQQPNMQYHPIPSMNNVVISPGQNSASFVLGSQQAVGASNVYMGSVEKESLFQRKPIQFGTVINEEINSHLAENMKPTKLPLYQEPEQQLFNSQQISHASENVNNEEMHSVSNIRFPNPPEQQNEYINNNIPETPVNGHAQPLSMQQLQQQGIQKPLVFPKPEQELDLQPPHNPIVFKPDSVSDAVPQKQEVLTLNQHLQNKMNYPQLPEDLTPPAEPQVPQPNRESNRPITSPGYVTPFTRHEYTRKPVSNVHRSDRPLPNILPQFRPNSKVSVGHSHHLKEPGTIRVVSKYPYRPSFSQRRPLGGNRYRISNEPPPQEANRRIYRVPSPSNSFLVYHHYPQRLPPHVNHPLRVPESYIGTAPPPSSLNGVPSVPQTQTQFQSLGPYPVYPKNGGENTERLAAFEEDDYPVKESDFIDAIEKIEEQPKLEPVVTLQMLQSQKKNTNSFDDQIGEKPAALQPNSDLTDLQKKQGVYVVYPAKAVDYLPDERQQEDTGTNGNAADYQNTPFSVVRDQPQEPILVVKNKPQQNKEKFPYPLEKPDPVYAELTKKDKYHIQPSVQLLPRVVNRRRDEITTEIPIAIAYTPTAPNRYYTNHKFSYPNLAGPVIKEIRETQTEAVMDDISDNRGHNYEKDFMAPFYPSMSLESATDSPNGWSVYQQQQEKQQQKQQEQQQQQQQQLQQQQQIHNKQNINRIDFHKDIEPMKMELTETTTRKYDPDSFQVELQGGFKPIYPPDYHLREAVNSNEMEFMNKYKHDMEDEEPIQRSSATSQAALTSTTPLPDISTKLKLVDESKISKVSEKLVRTTIAPSTTESTLIVHQKEEQRDSTTMKSITSTISSTSMMISSSPNIISSTSEIPPQRKKPKQPSLVSLLFGDYDDEDYDDKGTTESSYIAS